MHLVLYVRIQESISEVHTFRSKTDITEVQHKISLT